MNTVFKEAMEYYKNKNYEKASQYFNAVYTADPSRNDAKNYYDLSIKELNKKNRKKVFKINLVSTI
ncbi:MAG: hypothetical protein LBL16_04470 [Endomicrobium sp.]|nr:hypothetical protein [Endomicrobium sp.]